MLNIGGERIATRLPNAWITTHGPSKKKSLYLTFDDGPNDKFTLPLCELLQQYNAKATFFCVGKCVAQHPDIAKSIVEQGHLLANHSHRHMAFKTLSVPQQLAEADDCQNEIELISPNRRKIFRAPQGQLNPVLFLQLKARGWKIVHWSYDSLDYLRKPLDEHVKVFQHKPVRNGDVVLFHDDNQLAIDLLAVLLPQWQKQGFTFPTVAELID